LLGPSGFDLSALSPSSCFVAFRVISWLLLLAGIGMNHETGRSTRNKVLQFIKELVKTAKSKDNSTVLEARV
jgi:hypothetical protein